ncbi:hypothetical protein [Wolbachia endosymbiont of Trichogramma pretiosum]|uniref:hypothetical protein n=1 Tax=Wolbachia endosymbiont of Trichogramma pretiosum TaxID=125593 RepID=UPI001FE100A0|nr:hypothetical protein [Wolbachia endosymbiont of Trichogramma pretiosum]
MDDLQQLTLAVDHNTYKDEQVVLFFDELLWLEARKSSFLKSLEYFLECTLDISKETYLGCTWFSSFLDIGKLNL